MNLRSISKITVLFMKGHRLIFMSKMGVPNERLEYSSSVQGQFYLVLRLTASCGPKL